MRVIGQEVQDLKSVAAAVLDPAGLLLEANAGFMQLLGNSPARRIGANVALLFTRPSFVELSAAKATEGGDLYKGPFRVIDASGQTLELPGRAWRSAFGICVVAEYDIDAVREAARKREASGAPERELRFVEASLTDKLTGTGNRERLEESLTMEISRVRRTGLALSALMAGIDRMDEITARYGQAGGDKLLARFGFLLRLLTRPTDVAARYEAEQFVVLMPHTRLDQGRTVARRVHKALAAELVEPLLEPATASFGLAEFQPGEEASAFIKRLQSGLAKARQTGGDEPS
jgi:diguanylate cyclase (GGDEF)-like protein